jgi:hypothetical protein
LQLGRPNEEPVGLMKECIQSGRVFTMFKDYVMMYYAINDNFDSRNHLFFYKTTPKQLAKT